MVHFNQSGEVCVHISGAVIDKPELLTCLFVKWVFDGSDSLFTPRSLSQVLLENLGATDCRVSFFPSTLCVCCFVRQHYSPCHGENIPVWLILLYLPFFSARVSFCRLLKPHIRLEGNHSNAYQRKKNCSEVVNSSQKGGINDFK